MKKYDLTGIEVLGSGVLAVLEGLGSFKSLAQGFLNEIKIGEVDSKGNYMLKAENWYSLEKGIELNYKLLDKIGHFTMKNIGTKLPESAVFPPHITDIHSAVQSINIAYHMNHRKNGKVMFNPETGFLLSGIGSYGYEKIEGQNKIISICETPYPSPVDEGIILGIAKRFEPKVTVTLDKTKPSRKENGESDTFIISW